MTNFPFNVRVYGALSVLGHIMLSAESHGGRDFVKLPGGGLEFGEGLKDALKREFLEETGLEVKVTAHLYTTDFFVVSAFNPKHQVISIYYQVELSNLMSALPEVISREGKQHFTWVKQDELEASHFTFPVDKHMVPLLRRL
jgi:ADP-ribose pyrophosphatase YjhB (NUDIX family)